MPRIVASHKFIGRESPGEAAFPIVVEVSEAQPSAKMTPAWECTVSVRPIDHAAVKIYGHGSFQTLCLALRHAIQLLDSFIERGGSVEYEDGALIDTSVYGFRLLPWDTDAANRSS